MNPSAINQEQALKLAEITFDAAADAIMWIDSRGFIQRVNKTALERYGYSEEEFANMHITLLNRSVTLDFFMDFFNRLKEEKKISLESVHTTKDNRTIPVEIAMNYLKIGDSEYTCSIVRDISERRQVETAIKSITEETAGYTGEVFFQKLAQTIAKKSGYDVVCITQFTDESKTRVRTIACVKRGELRDNFEYDIEGTPCKVVLEGKEIFYPCNIKEDFPEDSHIEAYMGVPVYSATHEVLGHINCFNVAPADESDRKFLNILRIFALRAGAELERWWAEDHLKKAYTDLEELEHQSRLSHFTVNKASDAVFWVKSDARIIKVNEAACNRYGFTQEEFARMTVFDLKKEKNTKWWKEYFSTVKANTSLTIESTHYTKDGASFPVEVNANYIEYEGEGITCSFVRDITDRKRAENHLRIALEEVESLRDRLAAENVYLQQEIKLNHNFEEIVSNSQSFIEILNSVEQVAATDSTVLILGETGTGKELLARAIHNNSLRRDRPLVKVNCAALPANLIESELFGHEKGAFTGAFEKKIGRFELADKGTIFLDEVGELPIELQSKLLRVLQEGEFERLGNPKTQQVDVRVIAATNRSLEEEIKKGHFRSDLYYRLNVFPITIPPLRERKEDIPLLVRHFIRRHAPRIGRSVEKIPKSVLNRLEGYDWPGNIRELENIIERAIIISTGKKLVLGDWLPSNNSIIETLGIMTLAENERNHIIQALDQTNWKVSGKGGAAELLDIKPTTLEARMKKLGIHR